MQFHHVHFETYVGGTLWLHVLPSGGYYTHACLFPYSSVYWFIDYQYVYVSHNSRLHASNIMDIEHKGSFTLWILKPTLDELFGFSCWPQEDIMYIRADMPVPVLQLLLIHWLPADVERNSRLCTSNILDVKHERSITKYVWTFLNLCCLLDELFGFWCWPQEESYSRTCQATDQISRLGFSCLTKNTTVTNMLRSGLHVQELAKTVLQACCPSAVTWTFQAPLA